MNQKGQHAVVIGGSISGLLAARALADYYDQVTVLERDAFPEVGQGRKGVPQGYHAHGLLSKGNVILESFFPGYTQAVIEQGGRSIDIGKDMRFFNKGGYLRRVNTGLMALLASRPLLEGMVRSQLFQLPNVYAIQHCDVVGLTMDATGVNGVRLIRRHDTDTEEILSADMVVDSSGRGSRLPAWLEAFGYTAPAVEQLEIGITYTTCLFRDTPDLQPGMAGILIETDPATKRGGIAFRCEDGWRVTLIGYLGEQAPLEPQGFLDYARSLATPSLYDLIAGLESLNTPKHYKFPASQRRRYEQMTPMPERLLVVGDALCSFNPVYGQGMTIATMEAQLLHTCLADGVEQVAGRFFKQVGAMVDGAWNLSVGSDLVFPEVEGERTREMRFINWYFNRVTRAAQHNDDVARLFHSVINMMVSPAEMMAPKMMIRVLWNSRRTKAPRVAVAQQAPL
jgi:2-polyprenyl-6-methoxyphenol hydroxylase-like FAD-dependent oxidoreductase